MYHSHTYVCTDCEFRCTPSRVESYLSSFNDSLYYKSLDWLTHVGSEEDTYNSGRSAAQDVPSLSNSIALLQKESKEIRKSICDSVSIGRPGSCQTNHQPRICVEQMDSCCMVGVFPFTRRILGTSACGS